jgi:hypothetical protein
MRGNRILGFAVASEDLAYKFSAEILVGVIEAIAVKMLFELLTGSKKGNTSANPKAEIFALKWQSNLRFLSGGMKTDRHQKKKYNSTHGRFSFVLVNRETIDGPKNLGGKSFDFYKPSEPLCFVMK